MSLLNRLLGVLMGIAVRTGSPLGLTLAEPMWKLLAGSPIVTSDLAEVSLPNCLKAQRT